MHRAERWLAARGGQRLKTARDECSCAVLGAHRARMFRIALRRALKRHEHVPRASAAARGTCFRQPLHAGHQDPGGDTPRAQRPDDQSAHRPQEPGPDQGPGAPARRDRRPERGRRRPVRAGAPRDRRLDPEQRGRPRHERADTGRPQGLPVRRASGALRLAGRRTKPPEHLSGRGRRAPVAHQEVAPSRRVDPGIAEAVERQNRAMRELSRHAFPETDVVVPDDAPTPFDAARSERRRQAAVSRAAALRRARQERAARGRGRR